MNEGTKEERKEGRKKQGRIRDSFNMFQSPTPIPALLSVANHNLTLY